MAIFFYLFATMLVVSSFLVISSRNPIYSILWLIFSFCNASGLIILIGAEFLAMMLIIIYIGAVAVLFLFVIMMLNINFASFKKELYKNFWIGILAATFMLADLVIIILMATGSAHLKRVSNYTIPEDLGNVYAIGKILYTDFILPFQLAGIILFVAMIASISLTLRARKGVKRQNILSQLTRNKANSLNILRIDTTSGVEGLKYDKQ
ncbi:MAG: NADH-quinone oxidoreductase subunit J [Janthinobacterium lividum]